MPFLALLLLFLFLELFLMMMLAVEHGLGWSVFWFEVLTMVAGLWCIRLTQELTVQQMLSHMNWGQRPDLALFTGARFMLAGLLLMLPGFITDGLGAALIVLPALRSLLLRLFRFPSTPPRPRRRKSEDRAGRIIEGEIDRDPPD